MLLKCLEVASLPRLRETPVGEEEDEEAAAPAPFLFGGGGCRGSGCVFFESTHEQVPELRSWGLREGGVAHPSAWSVWCSPFLGYRIAPGASR